MARWHNKENIGSSVAENWCDSGQSVLSPCGDGRILVSDIEFRVCGTQIHTFGNMSCASGPLSL